MSTNKVYGDNPNKLKIFEKETRWELKNNENYYGIKETFPIDNATHSFLVFQKFMQILLFKNMEKILG